MAYTYFTCKIYGMMYMYVSTLVCVLFLNFFQRQVVAKENIKVVKQEIAFLVSDVANTECIYCTVYTCTI